MEIEYPGTWIDFSTNELSWEIKNIISLIETSFTEATIALSFFDDEKSKNQYDISKSYFEALSLVKQELIEKAQPLNKETMFLYNYEETEMKAKRKLWEMGFVPNTYSSSLVFIYAKTFLFSIDNIYKLIGSLCKYENIPNKILEVKSLFQIEFPDLIEVRNSAHHVEDRGRRLGKRAIPLDLKPIDNNMIKSSGGTLIMSCLNGNKYGNTMADGFYGEVEVSLHSLNFVRDCIQKIINSFTWKGSKSYYPN